MLSSVLPKKYPMVQGTVTSTHPLCLPDGRHKHRQQTNLV